MSIYDFGFDWDSGNFWTPLGARLRAVGVDLEARYGQDWMDVFEGAFSKWDLTSARLAMDAEAMNGPWIVDLGLAVADRLASSDFTVYSDSLNDALAFLLSRATAESLFPDAVRWDEAKQAIRFEVAGEIWAHVFHAKPEATSDATRSRAASTLLCVRRHTQPGEELLRRLRRWPGMADLVEEETPGRGLERSARRNYVPDPKEWRASAKTLLDQLELSAGEKQIQQLCCAVFAAPSWNHLVAAFNKYRAAGMQPCAVIEDRGDYNYRLVGIYADYFDALPHFLHAAAVQAPTWGGIRFEDLGSHGSPSYYLRAPSLSHNARWAAPSVNLSMLCRVSDEDEDRRNRLVVDSMIASEGGISQRLLEELFFIGASSISRRTMVEKSRQLQPIAEENGWRFHVWSGGIEPCLMVERVNASGNRLTQAVFVPLRKAQIRLVKSAGLYVVTGEYDGDRPEAVMDISSTTAKLVASSLPEMRVAASEDFPWNEDWWSPEDTERFTDLVEKMPRL